MPKNFSKYNKAVIIGRSLNKMSFFGELKPESLKTPYGKVEYFIFSDCLFVTRHGLAEKIPPHKINHLANIYAIRELGAKKIFSFNSTGSLKKELKPGDLIIASDYIDFCPPTFFDKEARFITPALSENLVGELADILNNLGIDFKTGATYFLTRGPRLETKAEINFMKNFADVVGMTMAKEATLAKELDLEYVSLCSVDNYCNGITKEPLLMADIELGQVNIREKFEKIIKAIAGIK
jgi:purine nucleoside phosphorylase